MWFGTDDGLNRYDGYNFKIFRLDVSDSNSISDNSIWSVMEDKKGHIWIGTKEGVLNRYDPTTEKFKHWKIESYLTEENSIKSLLEDSKGNIWIGSYKEGLYKLNPESNKINHWSANPNDEKSLSHNYVMSIIEDADGNIIVGTYNGLNKLNPRKPEDGFERFYYNPNTKNSLSSNLIWELTKSPSDPKVIWVETSDNLTKLNTDDYSFERITISNPENLQYGTSCNSVVEEIIEGEKIIWTGSYSGLIRINLSSGFSYRFVQDEIDPKSLISNQINQIIKDRAGVLWIVTENGISYSTPKSTSFNSLLNGNNNFNPNSTLFKKNITAISKSDKNRIWIGTTDGLYSLIDLQTNPKLEKINQFDGIHVWSLTANNEKELWVGTFGKGLKKYNYLTKKISDKKIIHPKIKTQSVDYIKSMLTDSKKNMWVGFWGVGVIRINPMTGKYNLWLNEPGNSKSLSHNDVWVIKEDRFSRIWLGTQGGGLNLFVENKDGIFHHWLQNEDEKNSLSSNNIYSIYEAKYTKTLNDSETILWIGTSNGLNKFVVKNRNPGTDLYDIDITNKFYTVKDGLPDNSVKSILEDDNGNLWLGTGAGISFFNISKNTFTNFSNEDGINSTVMNNESALIVDNDLMLFGSTKGLAIFNPKNIKLSSYKPNMVFTDFQIFNQSVKIGENSTLGESISFTKKIILTNNQNVFSFQFAALDYNSPQSINYAHKMEGFDNDWVEIGNRRFVTYTNLNHGEYTFKIKSTNADGVWCDNEAALTIVIKPPWWKTIWAYITYVILILMGLSIIRRFELNRTKLRNELKLKEFEVKQKSELEEIKSRFFANLSHEFRTPLMLIKGPLENLKNKNATNYDEDIDLIKRNSNRLENLIDQLLELSQLEKAAIPLKASNENIITILKGLVSSFESLAIQKNISLTFENNIKNEILWFDTGKFEKIINNLLSNAFKFTPEYGKVLVCINEISKNEKLFAEIKIIDSGISIPQEKIDNIFDRFYQVDDSDNRNFGGSGIGLSLVKEFIELHKWQIIVKSKIGIGTEFKIEIPYGDEHLSETEKFEALEIINNKKKLTDQISSEKKNIISEESFENKIGKPKILIVDDSADVRKYLTNLLKDKYFVAEEENGEKGIKAALEILPDLIISDIMMPSMNGMEFCSRLKSEWQTSDIPIILLTAKASFESKLEGLKIGADEYLTKPFDSRELFTRINNLLEQRDRLRKKYGDNFEDLFQKNNLTKADNEFMEKLEDIILKNIDKVNFNTELLAKELFVSRTKLHRKVSEISGQAPGEFIRSFKL
ncbi:MAG: two-component regulator propeller domain-containing protein, partial [Ignavibacteriaceae bacterium]